MVEVKNIDKSFQLKDEKLTVLNDLSFNVSNGEIYTILGLSGAGKTTLLKILSSLVEPDSGEIIIGGKEMTRLTGKELREARKDLGIVFQGYNLLMQKNVYKNVVFPLELIEMSNEERYNKTLKALKLVGLDNRLTSYPRELSGGEKQRVAIARAIVSDPKVLLLDEITSALDIKNIKQIIDLLKKINQEKNVTMLVITHDLYFAKEISDTLMILKDGKKAYEGSPSEISLDSSLSILL